MTFGPFSTDSIQDRIRDQVTSLRAVQGMADLANLANPDLQVPAPCAFVLLGDELAGELQGASGGVYRQRVTARIGVVLAVRLYGGDASALDGEIRPYLQAVRTACLNWRPTDALTVLEFENGRLLRQDQDGLAWWIDTYACDYWMEG